MMSPLATRPAILMDIVGRVQVRRYDWNHEAAVTATAAQAASLYGFAWRGSLSGSQFV